MSKLEEAPTTETKETPTAPELSPEQRAEWGDVMAEQTARKEEPAIEEEEPEKTPEETLEEEEPEEVIEEPEAAEPVLTAEDPGEYTPKDYSFEVELDGKTTKISTPEEAAKFADDHADKFDAPKLLAFMRKANKMETNLERDKEKYEEDKAKFDEQKEQAESQRESINSIAAEIQYLVSKGKLPMVEKKYAVADWNDPEIAKKPGVKEQVELLTYMRNENDARAKLGLKPITSAIDAYNSLQLESKDTSQEEARNKQAQARKDASGRVVGATPKPVRIAPKCVAVGRALNLQELDSLDFQ